MPQVLLCADALVVWALAGILAGVFLVSAVRPASGQDPGDASSSSARWQWTPALRIAGGEESDLVLDPGVTREIVSAGGFVEIAPSLRATRWSSSRQRIDFGTALSFQRYLQDEGRRLYGQSAWADLRRGLGDRTLLRMSLSVDAFDDSERTSVRRFGAGGELGLAWLHEHGSAEVWIGGRGRTYPELSLPNLDGTIEDYAEGGASLGLDLRLHPWRPVRFDARLVTQRTDATVDPYDSDALSASLGLSFLPRHDLRFDLYGSWQERDFTARAIAADDDAYAQVGFGVAWAGFSMATVDLRAAFARYRWPDGSEEDSHRVSVALRREWSLGGGGGSTARAGYRPDPGLQGVEGTNDLRGLALEDLVDAAGSIRATDAAGRVTFRLHAPEARSVHVAGDFDDWNPDTHRLVREADGWWALSIDLEPGRYEYAYVVDDTWITPPEAATTVRDGFGGRNGVLEVLGPEGPDADAP